MTEIFEKLNQPETLKKEDLISILKDDSINELLFKFADNIRKQNVGDDIYLRGLIEFSNICKCNCKYCGLRKDNQKVERYRLTPEQIVQTAKTASEKGYKTVVLQSGEDSYFSTETLCEIIKDIKRFDLALTLSIGEKTLEQYQAYKNAGADRYLLRIETTDKQLYEQMHPNASFENRVQCLKNLKKLNYELGTGCLVGLPNQTIESLANDILFFKEIEADMIGIGPFIPHPDTPLKNNSSGNFELSLKVMALTRIILPTINIPATTAMETLNKNGRIKALQAGANVIMPNVTAREYLKKYEIYPDKNSLDGTHIQYKENLNEILKPIERQISSDYGFHKK